MSWKKHFRAVDLANTVPATKPEAVDHRGANYGTSAKFSSYLPEVYAGHPQRVQRYFQYADMDKDSDIKLALDLISDFCTQSEEQADEPFEIKYNTEGTETEVKLLKECLTKWVKINNFRRNLFQIFRNVIMNGDAFFLRDPETQEWLWVDHFNVVCVRVQEDKGKEPAEYVVKGLDLNRKAKFATAMTDTSTTAMGAASSAYAGRVGGTQASGSFQLAGAHLDQRSGARPGQPGSGMDISVIDAKHMVHLSLSIGMDVSWPFGQSILDSIYKTYKQKEMLEDSIIIYRVQRAPERRVFYIDVGDMPPQKAQAHLTRVKNEIHQRRIPNRNGGGTGSMVDSAYNPLAMMDDYYFANTAGGRGSKVETLPGGDSLGEIGDLDYFTDKFSRGLGIPPNWLAITKDRANNPFTDGASGSAMIDEFRFNKMCLRLQGLLEPTFDAEFKEFVAAYGVNVEPDLFELRFRPPQNFSKHRQMDIDAKQLNVYAQISADPTLAKRWKFKRYLGMTDEDIVENEILWKQENPEKMKKKTGGAAEEGDGAGAAGFGDIGIRGGGMDFDDLGGDEDLGDPADGAGDAPAPAPGPGGSPAAPDAGAGAVAAAPPA